MKPTNKSKKLTMQERIEGGKKAYQAFVSEMQAQPDYEKNKQAARDEIELWEQVILLRERTGLTQTDLAKELGITQGRVSKMEKQGYDSYTVRTLRRLAEVGRCKVKIIFEPIDELQTTSN